MPTLLTLAADIVVLAGLTSLGVLLTRAVLGRTGALELASLAFPLGSGVFTWLLFLLSWGGIPLALPSILPVYGVALLALFWLARRRAATSARSSHVSSAETPDRPSRLALWTSLGLFLAVMMPLAVGRAHSQWDGAAGWIIKGYGIALDGDIRAGSVWGAWGLAYPLNVPLQVTLFRIFGADQLPGSMLIFPIYGMSMATGIYRFWQRQGVTGRISLLGAISLLTNPLVLLHSSIPYANLPTTVYIVLGACWLIEGLAEGHPSSICVGSLLIGLAGWTRPEAVTYGILLIPALVILFRISRRRWTPYRWAFLPLVVLVGTWAAFGWAAVEDSHLGLAMRGVLPKILAGDLRLFELYLIPRLLSKRAFEPEIWGYLFPIAGLLCLGGIPRLLRRSATIQQIASLLATVVIAAIPIGIFYVRAFTRQSDFIPLLNRSFDRAFLPAAVMLLVFGFQLAFGRGKEAEPIGGSQSSIVAELPA